MELNKRLKLCRRDAYYVVQEFFNIFYNIGLLNSKLKFIVVLFSNSSKDNCDMNMQTNCLIFTNDTIYIDINRGFAKNYNHARDFRKLVTNIGHELGHIFYEDVYYFSEISKSTWYKRFLCMLKESRADIFSVYFSSLIFNNLGLSLIDLSDFNWIKDTNNYYQNYLSGYFTSKSRKEVINIVLRDVLSVNTSLCFNFEWSNIYNYYVYNYLINIIRKLKLNKEIKDSFFNYVNSIKKGEKKYKNRKKQEWLLRLLCI